MSDPNVEDLHTPFIPFADCAAWIVPSEDKRWVAGIRVWFLGEYFMRAFGSLSQIQPLAHLRSATCSIVNEAA